MIRKRKQQTWTMLEATITLLSCHAVASAHLAPKVGTKMTLCRLIWSTILFAVWLQNNCSTISCRQLLSSGFAAKSGQNTYFRPIVQPFVRAPLQGAQHGASGANGRQPETSYALNGRQRAFQLAAAQLAAVAAARHRVQRDQFAKLAAANSVPFAAHLAPLPANRRTISERQQKAASEQDEEKLLICYYTTRQAAPYWPKDAREFVVPAAGKLAARHFEQTAGTKNNGPSAATASLNAEANIENQAQLVIKSASGGSSLLQQQQQQQHQAHQGQQRAQQLFAGGQMVVISPPSPQPNEPSAPEVARLLSSSAPPIVVANQLDARQDNQLPEALALKQARKSAAVAPDGELADNNGQLALAQRNELLDNGLIVGAYSPPAAHQQQQQQRPTQQPVGLRLVGLQAPGSLDNDAATISANRDQQQQQQATSRTVASYALGLDRGAASEALQVLNGAQLFVPTVAAQQQAQTSVRPPHVAAQSRAKSLQAPETSADHSMATTMGQQQQQQQVLFRASSQAPTMDRLIVSSNEQAARFSASSLSSAPGELGPASYHTAAPTVSPGGEQASTRSQQQQQLSSRPSGVGGDERRLIVSESSKVSQTPSLQPIATSSAALQAASKAPHASQSSAQAAAAANAYMLLERDASASTAEQQRRRPVAAVAQAAQAYHNAQPAAQQANVGASLSSTLVSSPLATMFDVFGAASQYLMRFKPSSLISPSSTLGSSFNSLLGDQQPGASPKVPGGAAIRFKQQAFVTNSNNDSLLQTNSFNSMPYSSGALQKASSNERSSGASQASNSPLAAKSASPSSALFLSSLSAHNNQQRDDICGRTIQTPERRIIGGEGARYGEFPYQVHIKIAKHQCGGALVDRQSIVTAAHCVYHFITRAPVSKLQIVIGAYDIEDEQYQELPPQYFKVNKVKLHPNFRFSASHPDRYDIAILKLDKPVKYTDNVLPVCLPSKELKFESSVGTVTGFGKTDPSLSNRYGTRLLQKVDVPIIENSECERWHRTRGIDLKIFPEMMCAGYEDGLKDACVGDSGGPLVVKTPIGSNGAFRWTLAGITSAGFGCAQSRQPGIYHRVSHTVDWILENID